ncbi:hypothetical protein GIB67_039726 [Kingdonia uniflora]|uniref:CG-1 domain-containing protein n=1 Tax=Kingdonia uniflora TaxID=39325 RepID=A0A7J7MPV1_9MAGN|nr:hypothetical protein GIB67_039726 [Kingdonia uniflora]
MLQVGNEEKIHVYYAHGEDNPSFVRRCYWLLDKKYEQIVLVHYRETFEVRLNFIIMCLLENTRKSGSVNIRYTLHNQHTLIIVEKLE